VQRAFSVLINLLHRGACGCEANTGDGAGILVQIPDKFLRRECLRLGISLPPVTEYGCGFVFLPRNPEQRDIVRALLHSIVEEEGQRLLGWREVPTDDHLIGASAPPVEPHIMQVFIGRGPAVRDHVHFERKLYVIRKLFEKAVVALDIPENKYAYMPSLSSNTLIYKGMLSADSKSESVRSGNIVSIWLIPTSSRRWRWSTSGSAPSRPGRSRTHIATSPTTARSTRSGATSTG